MKTSEAPELIGFAHRTLRSLRVRVAATGPGGPDALREAGFAGAESLFSAFETWALDQGIGSVKDMPMDQFSSKAADFFQRAGWGKVSFRSLHDAVGILDIEGCWEAALHGAGETGCHLTTGTLAGFFGCLADYPVAVMEIECAAGDSERCRFLVGTPEMLEHAYERLARGEAWSNLGLGES
jgi:predicted hydrocarbon binding protein